MLRPGRPRTLELGTSTVSMLPIALPRQFICLSALLLSEPFSCPSQHAALLPDHRGLPVQDAGRPTRQKLGNRPLPPPGAGVWRDTGRDPRVHVERERAGHLAVAGSPPVRRYGPPQPPLQPFPLCQTLLDRGSRVHTLISDSRRNPVAPSPIPFDGRPAGVLERADRPEEVAGCAPQHALFLGRQ